MRVPRPQTTTKVVPPSMARPEPLPGGVPPHPQLRGTSILSLREVGPQAIDAVVRTAEALKAMPRARWPRLLDGRAIALVFERPSTRTRVSFDVGIAHLGGHPLTLNARDLQLGRGETIRDTALVLSRMVSAIMLRTGAHAIIEELAKHARVPVINGLTHDHHPCQGLADVLTIHERFSDVPHPTVAYLGDGNNVCVSLMIAGAMMGMNVVAACPEGYTPPAEMVEWANAAGAEVGGSARVVDSPQEAAAAAHVLYTDTWVSMGDEEDRERRIRDLHPYRIDEALIARAHADVILMHCLPAHHGEEVATDLLYASRSAVWDQAENRIHAQAALLAHVLA